MQHDTTTPTPGRVKVLLADTDAERAGALAETLARDPALSVIRIPHNASLADAVAAIAPDVLIVDMARPDRDALEGVRQVTAAEPRPVVLFVDQDDPAFMEAAIAAGVSSYNVLGTPPPDVKPILRAAVALFRRHQRVADDKAAAERQLQDRITIDRAKLILIREHRLSEPDAYRWLRRRAMSQGRKLADVAAGLVRAHERPGDAGA